MKKNGQNGQIGLLLVAMGLCGGIFGCGTDLPADWPSFDEIANPTPQRVPAPLDIILPHEIKIHPFTGTRKFDGIAGLTGIDVRVEVLDKQKDSTKAFGRFHFQLYSVDPVTQERGPMVECWPGEDKFFDLSDPKTNIIHWNRSSRMYQFKLALDKTLTPGHPYVLAAVFTSAFSNRLFAELNFSAGS